MSGGALTLECPICHAVTNGDARDLRHKETCANHPDARLLSLINDLERFRAALEAAERELAATEEAADALAHSRSEWKKLAEKLAAERDALREQVEALIEALDEAADGWPRPNRYDRDVLDPARAALARLDQREGQR